MTVGVWYVAGAQWWEGATPTPPKNNRLCLSCYIGAAEDEVHFLNTCSAYEPIRKSF
jgi:hypothetical protein